MSFDLHLDHFQGPSQYAAKDIGVPELILRPSVIGKLHEVSQGIFVKDQRKLLVVVGPVGYLGSNIQKDLESNLPRNVSIR